MHFPKNVGTKITTFLTVASLMTQAHSVLQELDIAPSLEQMTAFLRDNRTKLPQECSALEFTCNVWHEKTHDEIAWQQITQHFVDLAHACQQSDTNIHDTRWLTLLGQPASSMLARNTPGDGIQEHVTVSTDDAKLQFTVRVERSQISCPRTCRCEQGPCMCTQASCACCNTENRAWENTLDTFVIFVLKCSKKPEADAFKACGPVITQTLALAGANSGIHGEIKACLYDNANNYFKLAYTKDPDAENIASRNFLKK